MISIEKWKSERRQKKQAQVQTEWQRYSALIGKVAEHGLAEADTENLNKLADSLGRNEEQVDADVSAISSIKSYERRSANLEPLRQAYEKAIATVNADAEETKRIEDAHTALIRTRANEHQRLAGVKHDAQRELHVAMSALNSLSFLRARQWRLLGLAEAPPVEFTNYRTYDNTFHTKPITAKEAKRMWEERQKYANAPDYPLPDTDVLAEDDVEVTA